MKESLVNKQTAIEARDKGFDWSCGKWFWHIEEKTRMIHIPSLAMLQRWFRERHNIHMHVEHYYTMSNDLNTPRELRFNSYLFEHMKGKPNVYAGYKTYEDALSRALDEALKLI